MARAGILWFVMSMCEAFDAESVERLQTLAFREARFEKLEIEKLNFEAGSSVLKLLKFEPWKLHFKASRLCREAPKWSFQKLHFGAAGLHTVTLKSFGGCLQTSSMSFFFY